MAEGATRFRAHVERVEAQETGNAPGGRLLMKLCLDRFTAGLEAYLAEVRTGHHAAKDPLVPVVALLGVEHVAALVFQQAGRLSLLKDTADTAAYKIDSIVSRAGLIGDALEHDFRIRVWAKDADAAAKRAITRMKRDMEGDPRSWRRRRATLKEMGTRGWSREKRVTMGMDLLKVLTDCSPDVFTTRLVRHGHKTVRVFGLTEDASRWFSDDEQVSAVSSPRWGMMIVRPRPWAYSAKEAT